MDRANETDQSRAEFVSNVSHELKTPITSIKVLAESLNTQENVPIEVYQEFMQDIVSEIDRESKIIEDLLTLVRMDKSVATLNITSVNMNDLLEMTLKRVKPLAQKKNIELLFESFRPVVAQIDEVKMTQVISNLVENSIKYNVEDGWVHVSLNADYQYFYIRVEDSGIGIPEESINKIFERFYRVDKARSRETGGTGLGLAIVRNIILMHHGTIKVHSEENIGMGTNFTSLFAYYLASPSNWFVALFPQKYTIEIMNAFIILKIAGSSLSLTYYLTKHNNNKHVIAAIFGMFYGMSGFIAAYSWNIMWLDCVILVPLIMLGLERLVNENRCIFYCITLGLCIFTNYYIAIMVCLSVVIYYVVLMIAYNGIKSPMQYVKKFINFCVYSLLAGGLGACLLLPEFYTFSLSASSDTTFPDKLISYFSILSMLTRQLINIPVHLGLDHLPNIYCGVAVFVLLPLYIMCSKVNAREKIGKCVILLIFLTAFNLNIPNYIWHGMHFPNSLPCRQSFIYIFFLLAMCYEAVINLKNSTNKQLGASLWIAIGLLLIMEELFINSETEYSFKSIYISGIFILIYGLLMFIHNNARLKIPVVLMLAFSVSIIECTLNMDATGIGTTSRTSYLLDYDAVKTVTKTVSDNDTSFYRMDKLFGARSKNDGAWHNYRTVSTFSSTCNAGMSKLYNLIGMENSTNAYGCNGLTAVTDSLFSVKYTISNRLLVESDIRNYYTGSDGEFVYKNNYTLPIGYAINSSTAYDLVMAKNNNGIENQNLLIQSLTGISDVFEYTTSFPTEADCIITPAKSGHMYLSVANKSVDSVTVTINNTTTYTYTDQPPSYGIENNIALSEEAVRVPVNFVSVYFST
jgi:uncharacterized membrane protein YfhO